MVGLLYLASSEISKIDIDIYQNIYIVFRIVETISTLYKKNFENPVGLDSLVNLGQQVNVTLNDEKCRAWAYFRLHNICEFSSIAWTDFRLIFSEFSSLNIHNKMMKFLGNLGPLVYIF